jgi:hypothetical protein
VTADTAVALVEPSGLGAATRPRTHRPAPVADLLLGAPTTAVDLEMATEPPKKSREAPSEAVSLACWDQAVPERANSYAAPCEIWPGAPATAADPRWPPRCRRSRSWRGRGRSAWPAGTRPCRSARTHTPPWSASSSRRRPPPPWTRRWPPRRRSCRTAGRRRRSAGAAFAAGQAARGTAVLLPPTKGQRHTMPPILRKIIAAACPPMMMPRSGQAAGSGPSGPRQRRRTPVPDLRLPCKTARPPGASHLP